MGRRQEPDIMSEIVLHKANLLLELSTFNLKLSTGECHVKIREFGGTFSATSTFSLNLQL